MTPSISLIFFAKKTAHPFAVNLRSFSTMNVVVGKSFFLVTCSDWPFVAIFLSGQIFFPVLRKQSRYFTPVFFLNYVWILLLSLLLYSLPSHCSRITSIRSGLCRLVIVSSYIRAQLFLCSLIALHRDSNKIQQFQCFISFIIRQICL